MKCQNNLTRLKKMRGEKKTLDPPTLNGLRFGLRPILWSNFTDIYSKLMLSKSTGDVSFFVVNFMSLSASHLLNCLYSNILKGILGNEGKRNGSLPCNCHLPPMRVYAKSHVVSHLLTVTDLHTEIASAVRISLAKLSGCTVGLDSVIIIITIIGLMTKIIQVVITWSHPQLLSDSVCLAGCYNHVFLMRQAAKQVDIIQFFRITVCILLILLFWQLHQVTVAWEKGTGILHS